LIKNCRTFAHSNVTRSFYPMISLILARAKVKQRLHKILLGNMSCFPILVRHEKEESGRKINIQSQKNKRFTWFTSKGYVHRIAADFTMIEKIIQETFTIHKR
jgi:hypothetical protein